MVTGGVREKKSENMGFFCTTLRLRPFSTALMECTQRAPKPDMHSTERLELYICIYHSVYVSYGLNSAILLFRPDGVPMSRQR